ncbi:hypothetical protein ACWZHB_05310 [Nocardia sp. FBN12]
MTAGSDDSIADSTARMGAAYGTMGFVLPREIVSDAALSRLRAGSRVSGR